MGQTGVKRSTLIFNARLAGDCDGDSKSFGVCKELDISHYNSVHEIASSKQNSG